MSTQKPFIHYPQVTRALSLNLYAFVAASHEFILARGKKANNIT